MYYLAVPFVGRRPVVGFCWIAGEKFCNLYELQYFLSNSNPLSAFSPKENCPEFGCVG